MNDIKAAKSRPNKWVVLQGDWGGQVYLTCPAGLIVCDGEALGVLLAELDKLAWPSNQGQGAGLYVKPGRSGTRIDGGAPLNAELWVHEEFEPKKEAIKEVLLGKRSSIL